MLLLVCISERDCSFSVADFQTWNSYKLTSTGSAPSGQGTGGASGQSITVMVTNLCPYSGNEKWCPQR